LEVRDWKLEVGSWRLEVGGWKLEVGADLRSRIGIGDWSVRVRWKKDSSD